METASRIQFHFVLAAVPLIAPSGFAQVAEESPIITDRPGFLFSPILVPEGRLQLEAGLPTFTRARSGDAEARTWSLPVAARYGLSDRLELRASLPTWADVRVDDVSSSSSDDGFSDVEIGAKFAIDTSTETPFAVQGSLRLPSGSDGFTTDELGGSLYLLHTRELPNGMGITGLLGATYAPVDGGPDPLAGAIGALLWSPITDELSGYVEAAVFPGIQGVAGQVFAGGALVWLVRDDVQLDLSADFGLDDDSADVIAAFGVSVRF